jgi:hypothetical protein
MLVGSIPSGSFQRDPGSDKRNRNANRSRFGASGACPEHPFNPSS